MSSTSDSKATGGGQKPDSPMRKFSDFTSANSSSTTPKNQQASHTETSTLVGQVDAVRRASTGSFGSIFDRGFFAKPVIGNQQDNYRYIMALDR